MSFLSRIKNNYKNMDNQNQKNVMYMFYGLFTGVLIFLITLLIIFLSNPVSADGAGNIVCKGKIAVNGDNIYYCGSDGISVFNKKSSETLSAADIPNCSNLVVYNNNLYFIGGMTDRGIYKTDTVSGNTELLIKTFVAELDVKNGIMIYFSADDGRIYQADENGRFRRPVTENTAESFCFDGRYVYFGNESGFFRYDVKKRSEIHISEKYSGTLLNECNGRIFYYNESDKTINCLVKKNGKNLLVAKCSNGCNYINIYQKGKRLFYSDGEELKQIKIKRDEFTEEKCIAENEFYIYDGCCYSYDGQSVKCVKIEEILD